MSTQLGLELFHILLSPFFVGGLAALLGLRSLLWSNNITKKFVWLILGYVVVCPLWIFFSPSTNPNQIFFAYTSDPLAFLGRVGVSVVGVMTLLLWKQSKEQFEFFEPIL